MMDLEKFEARTFRGENGDVLPYRLLTPENLVADKRFPLVVFLHGAGERGDDNRRQLCNGVQEFLRPELRNAYPCFVLAPQCPADTRWVECDWSDPEPHKQPEQPSCAMRLLQELIPQFIKNNPVNVSRIYAAGISMGAFGTWDLLARQPELFAAAVPVCGGADVSTAAKIAHVPVWVWHGACDTVVPAVRSRRMVTALQEAGAQPKYTELPEVQHNSWIQAFGSPELYPWLFSQQKK